ncbi:hypothetical protein [Blastococcus sp. TF02A-30]|uniref:hypothetical protein n=1 Tax=Blastococcus sp. TF02A-30 TaxID=2250580 RepID=UPI001314A06E|nr:hypothetical protein [Blastococcus sp. TF02A-30]
MPAGGEGYTPYRPFAFRSGVGGGPVAVHELELPGSVPPGLRRAGLCLAGL